MTVRQRKPVISLNTSVLLDRSVLVSALVLAGGVVLLCRAASRCVVPLRWYWHRALVARGEKAAYSAVCVVGGLIRHSFSKGPLQLTFIRTGSRAPDLSQREGKAQTERTKLQQLITSLLFGQLYTGQFIRAINPKGEQ